MKTSILILSLIVFASCATIDGGKDFSAISIGMSKAEVLAVKGKPYETSASGGTEYFIYATYLINGNGKNVTDTYFVRFVRGKVDSYGRVGDFDSTKDL
jgi:hypothetical protein